MNINIKDENLSKILQLKLFTERKNNIDEIEDLSITNKNLADEVLHIDLCEINKLKNLRNLSIKFFQITDEVIECINNLESLEELEILCCDFQNTKYITKQIKKLTIYNCKNFKIETLKNNITELISLEHSGIIDIYDLTKFNTIKTLRISECTAISLPRISMFTNLENLYLTGISLDLDFDISKMKKLKFICLNGSKAVDNEKYIQDLKKQNSNVKIQFKDSNLPIQ